MWFPCYTKRLSKIYTHSGNEGFFKVYMVTIPLLCFKKSSESKFKHKRIRLNKVSLSTSWFCRTNLILLITYCNLFYFAKQTDK